MNLVFLLGDQLSPSISALEGCDRARDIVLMAQGYNIHVLSRPDIYPCIVAIVEE